MNNDFVSIPLCNLSTVTGGAKYVPNPNQSHTSVNRGKGPGQGPPSPVMQKVGKGLCDALVVGAAAYGGAKLGGDDNSAAGAAAGAGAGVFAADMICS